MSHPLPSHQLSAAEFIRRESAAAMAAHERRREVAAEAEARLPVHEFFYRNGKRVPCGGKGKPTAWTEQGTGKAIHACRKCGRHF